MTPAVKQHSHTTIKVTQELRDRLKLQAKASGRTLGDQLAFLVKLGERQSHFEALSAAIAATPPELLASYEEETEYWDRVSGV
jgi:phage I-like protein